MQGGMRESPPGATLAGVVESRIVCCPYCGETFETGVDASGGSQEYIEDCQVCCRPIVFRVRTDADGHLLEIETRREDD